MTIARPDDRQIVLAESIRELRRLRRQVEALQSEQARRTEPIAVIGMGCRMPGGVSDPEEFWRFLRDGRDASDDIPAERWDVDRYYTGTPGTTGEMSTRRGNFVSGVDEFDAAFFGVSPREAAALDPQQRILLEVAWAALEDAGLSPDRMSGSSTGVFVGVTTADYHQLQMQYADRSALDAYLVTGSASPFGAGRLSYLLGLTGPSLTVDTACSSSLVGLHLACRSLSDGECDTALAGGVNLLLAPEPFMVLSAARMLAADGRCKTFSRAADGYARGEGCGVVVLRRLSDAVAAGDRVLAVVRGTAVNQDGRSSGLTVPNPVAQQQVVQSALRTAGVSPDEVSYVEAHGTGTPLGDPLELRALSGVLCGPERSPQRPLLVGSVKTNIGHLEPAAGVAGLIKVILSLRAREIPPHLHLSEVNPEIDLVELQIDVPTATVPWPDEDGSRPIAGVSSFGASGTNAHAILQQAPSRPARPGSGPDEPLDRPLLLPLSARSPDALRELAARYRDHLAGDLAAVADAPVDDDEQDDVLQDACHTAAVGRAALPHRAAVVATDRAGLLARLDTLATGASAEAAGGVTIRHVPTGTRNGVVFVYTGQGAERPGMGWELYRGEPVFRRAVDRCDEVLAPLLGHRVPELLTPDGGGVELLASTRYVQPLMFCLEYALTELLASWGVEPAAVIGHSVGEFAAAHTAGVLGLDDALQLVALRGELMQTCGEGRMVAVLAAPEDVEDVLGDGVGLAAINGESSVVLSGPLGPLDEAVARLTERGVRTRPLASRRAFHSAAMDPVLADLETAARAVTFAHPRIPLLGGLTGAPLGAGSPFDAGYVREQARRPVRFHAGVQALLDFGHRVFVEIGPSPALSGMVRRSGVGRSVTVLPTLRTDGQDRAALAAVLGGVFAAGGRVDWDAYHRGPRRRRAALPTYPFKRTRYWFTPADPDRQQVAVGGHGILGAKVDSPLPTVQFRADLSPRAHPCLAECTVDGVPVVNIGVYLEAFVEAAGRLLGSGPVGVRELLVLQSLPVRGMDRLRTAVLADLDADGRARCSFQAWHSVPDGEGRWVEHARAVVEILDRTGPGGTPAGLRAEDQPEARARSGAAAGDADAVHRTAEEFYRRMEQRAIVLGPSARWVAEISGRDGRALATMRAPGAGETRGYVVHPGLIDAMFQTLFAILPPDGEPDEVYMVVGVDSIVVHEAPGDRPVRCEAVLLPATVPGRTLVAQLRLVDESGAVLVEADGAYLKRAEHGAVAQNADRAVDRASAGTVPATGAAGGSTGHGSPAESNDLPAAVVHEVCAVLRATPEEVDTDEPLQQIGIDSLMALEIRDRIAAVCGVRLPLVAFLEGHSVRTLTALLLESVEAPEAQGTLVHDPEGRYLPFPLTDLQQAYLIGRGDAYALGQVSTYFLVEVDLEGLDPARLEDALNGVVARHDMLRAIVAADGTQRVLPEVPRYRIRVEDLRDLDGEDAAAALTMTREEMRDQVLDCSTWPLFDVRLSRTGPDRWRLHVGVEALAADAWSTSTVFRDWEHLYHARGDELPVTSVQFRDYVLAIQGTQESDEYRTSLRYWRERATVLPPAPDLPLAKDPMTVARPEFTHRSTRLDAQRWERFKTYAQRAGVTPSAAVCAAYARCLAAWSRNEHFTLNLLYFNRLPLHPDVTDIVGNFSTTTLLEVAATHDVTFAELAGKVQRGLWTDLEHSRVSGVTVLREVNRHRGGQAPIGMPVVFASTVNFAARHETPAAVGLAQHLVAMGESGAEVASSIRTPQVWLDHQIVEDAGQLVVNWDAVEEIFPAGMLDTMFEAYADLLGRLCDDPAGWQEPGEVPVPARDLAVRRLVNDTVGPVPGGLLHHPFLARVAEQPDRVAVIGSRILTYAELERISAQAARALVGRGVRPGDRVAVVMEKGWQQVAAVLGVLRAGGVFVPVDADVPPERLRTVLHGCGASVALTQAHVADRLVVPDTVDLVAVDGEEVTAQDPRWDAEPPVEPTDLAYIIYTSGSTGVPKGVMIEHRSALNTVVDVNERFGVTSDDRVLGLSALNFDLSVYDVFGMLAAGAAVVLPDARSAREPQHWVDLVREHRVTVWNTVPALMQMLVDHLASADREPGDEALPLRLVMMSGDWIPVPLPDRIRSVFPAVGIWSLGGATEASIWSILHPIGEVDPSWASIPYGVPMRNQQMHVLDESLCPRPAWVPGDLYIGGIGLARGYFADPERTAAAFITHPVTGERLYRTGDLGRYLPDGTIEFLGREDFQVKVQGYRIELGEVETAMGQAPGVGRAVATAFGERSGPKRLVGYVVPADGCDVRPEDVLEHLRKTLPPYVIPAQIVPLAGLPLSANQKVDRSALPAPETLGHHDHQMIRPRDEVEEILVELWEDLFDQRPISVTARFFDLGGDSLMATRLMARIRARTGRSLPLSVLFRRPTIEALAGELRAGAVDTRPGALVPIRTDGDGTPLFLVHPVGGDVLCYAALSAALGGDRPVYGLRVPDRSGRHRSATTVAEMAAAYLDEVRTVQPSGPYLFGGWSMGGVVAIEMAAQAEAASQEVALVAAVDLLEPPGPHDTDVDHATLLTWLARDLAGQAGLDWRPTPDEFAVSDPAIALGALHTACLREGALPPDVDVETLAGVLERFSLNARALSAHRPTPCRARVQLFRAADGGSSPETVRAWADLLGDRAGAVDVPGDHFTPLAVPLVSHLAVRLSEVLAEADGR